MPDVTVALPESRFGRYVVHRFGQTETWQVLETSPGLRRSVAWCGSEKEAIAEAKKLAAADRKEQDVKN